MGVVLSDQMTEGKLATADEGSCLYERKTGLSFRFTDRLYEVGEVFTEQVDVL
jgi:hypothetical protein